MAVKRAAVRRKKVSGVDPAECPALALNRPRSRDEQCLLMGVKQTQGGHRATSESDPKQTQTKPQAGSFDGITAHGTRATHDQSGTGHPVDDNSVMLDRDE
jgi:hypothetical protein